MGWDKAAEERTQQAAETLASMRDYEANQDAEAIRAALGRIKELEAGNLPSVQVLIRNLTRRAEAAERDAQQQRERADRLELQVYALGKNLDAAGCHRLLDQQRIATLEAALREARGFLPAKDSAYYLLSEELRRVIGEVDDALAAQPAQEVPASTHPFLDRGALET